MTTSEPTEAEGTRPAATVSTFERELIRAAAARLPGARLVVGLAAGSAPVVVAAGPDGSVSDGDGLVLPMQALFARVRGRPEATADLVPPELAPGAPLTLAVLDHRGFRGVLIVAGQVEDGSVAPVADALAMGVAASGAASGTGPTPAGALGDLAALLASSPQPGRTLTRLAGLVSATTAFDRCTVLVAGHGGGLAAVASETAQGPAPLGPWRALLAAFSLDVGDAAPEGRLPEQLEEHLEGGVLVVPMEVWGEPVGLVVCDRGPARAAADEVRLVAGLAAQAAVGVKIAHLVDALDQGRRHAQLVLGAMAHTATQLSTGGVLSVVVEAVHEVLGDDTVVGLTTEAGEPVSIARSGEAAGADEVAAAIAATPPPVAAATRYGGEVAGVVPPSVAARRALVVPIRRLGRHLASLVSYGSSTIGYRESDLRVVGALASQAALSLHTVRLLEAEREAVARLEEVSRLKTGFVATVSHELRTPLTAILGFSEILTEWIEDPEVRSFVEDVRREAVVLEGIIGNLLDTTRLEAGVLALDRSPVDVELLVKEAMDVVGHSYPGRNLSLDVQPPLPQVWADQVRVRQILLNLLENAAKYSPDGADIGVAVGSRDGIVRIEVVDRGPGIPVEFRERVFERFFRLEGRHGKPGTGIGLYLVRELVEAHGGMVAIEDGPGGVGCRVVVELPAG